MLMVEDIKEQQDLFNNIMMNNLSVREIRSRIHLRKAQTSEPQIPQVDPETEKIEEQLRELLGTKVKLQKEGQGGKLTINFYSNEELLSIIGKLIKEKESAQQTKEEILETPDPNKEFSM